VAGLPNHEEGISKLRDAFVRSERLARLVVDLLLETTAGTVSLLVNDSTNKAAERSGIASSSVVVVVSCCCCCCCCCYMAVLEAHLKPFSGVCFAGPANADVGGALDLAYLTLPYPRLIHAVLVVARGTCITQPSGGLVGLACSIAGFGFAWT
jgi:hypothetical protein